ncbi:MAG: hypothetical protein VX278_13565 [Myxococcota bacterium]|nr:hypothetical protein [Myxococcota bacterium]
MALIAFIWAQEPEDTPESTGEVMAPTEELEDANQTTKESQSNANEPANFDFELSLGEEQKRVLLETPPTEEHQKLLDTLLLTYLKSSEKILIGTLMASKPTKSNNRYDKVMRVEVERWLRGKGDKISEFVVPYNAPYIPNDPTTVPPILIDSYRILIFVGPHKTVLDGNAIFVLANGYAWRNKYPGLFLNPIYDRKWKQGNPHDDYIKYSIADLEDRVRRDNEGLFFRNLFR